LGCGLGAAGLHSRWADLAGEGSGEGAGGELEEGETAAGGDAMGAAAELAEEEDLNRWVGGWRGGGVWEGQGLGGGWVA
jgi:hypothetical protein